jgi:membrane protease YdiL (CAAX protease family)
MAFGVVVAVVFVVAQIAVAIPYLIVQQVTGSEQSLEAAASGLDSDGLFTSIAEVIAGSIAIALILFLVWIRRGPGFRDYLALRLPTRFKTLQWLLYGILLAGLLDGLSYLFGYAIVPPWMQTIYRSAVFLPLLLVALLVVAPVLEELFFRAFLFEGVCHTRLGDLGAILVASLVWASIHLQYEWFYIGQIFALGLLLGVARSRTGSIVPPMLMHSLFNGIATVQVMLETP